MVYREVRSNRYKSSYMNANLCNCCNSPEHVWQPNRREFLFVGLVGSLGLTLGNVLKLQAQSVSGQGPGAVGDQHLSAGRHRGAGIL